MHSYSCSPGELLLQQTTPSKPHNYMCNNTNDNHERPDQLIASTYTHKEARDSNLPHPEIAPPNLGVGGQLTPFQGDRDNPLAMQHAMQRNISSLA